MLELTEIAPYRYRIAVGTVPGMNSAGEVIASPALLPAILSDKAIEQVANVATLPGIVGNSLALPDIHWGYGFPIGGVAAFDTTSGVISPGGVGYDINCGVTLLRTNLHAREVRPIIDKLLDKMFQTVPCGVASEGKVSLSPPDFESLLSDGAEWVVRNGYASEQDLRCIESGGKLAPANPDLVSKRAKDRAHRQLGTLGSGNHFLEVQEVADICDPATAKAFGLYPGGVTVMIHSGSRGLGHQVCEDYLKVMQAAVRRYGITLPDRQLACAPIQSDEGKSYRQAMNSAANFAFANRLMMVGLVRQTFEAVLNKTIDQLGMELVWDVAHNIAKFETTTINGWQQPVCVHRKGATRALPPGHSELPPDYAPYGQPVLVPGDMGRESYLLAGTDQATELTFSSTCHGAGRVLSRTAAIKQAKGMDVPALLARHGITVRAKEKATLFEEMPEAYKNVSEVVNAVVGSGICRKIARMTPIGTVKG